MTNIHTNARSGWTLALAYLRSEKLASMEMIMNSTARMGGFEGYLESVIDPGEIKSMQSALLGRTTATELHANNDYTVIKNLYPVKEAAVLVKRGYQKMGDSQLN